MFNAYKLRYDHTLQGTLGSPGPSPSRVSSPSSSSTEIEHDHEVTCKFTIEQDFSVYKIRDKGDRVKSELEKYFGEDVEIHREKFDILNWWKVNTQRFSILSKVARAVSTVALETAFSTNGHVLNAFRSSLSPKIVQAIIYAQDWFRKDS
ncbi:UNVERIFIED_CONTAM: Zinc finger BED domain-containing protein RICESLEEPER 2 [Sesamum indicum]